MISNTDGSVMLQYGELREKIVSVGVSPDSSESSMAPLRRQEEQAMMT